MLILIFDTETTGLPADYQASYRDSDNWPRCIQLAWQLVDSDSWRMVQQSSQLVFPEDFDIPEEAAAVHGYSTEACKADGRPLRMVLSTFAEAMEAAQWICGHNISFDKQILAAECHRLNMPGVLDDLLDKQSICTKESGTDVCKIPNPYGRDGYKWPKLVELHQHLFGEDFDNAHDALGDVTATARCLRALVEQGAVQLGGEA